MFHLLAYTDATGGSVTDHDMVAATDSEYSQRNNHYIFTEPYVMLAACVLGANVSRQRFSVPTWNQYTQMSIYPFNKSATVPSPPMIMNMTAYPLRVPQNEEFQVLNTSTASETDNTFLWIAPPNWTRNLPQGKDPVPILTCRITKSLTGLVANTWSGLTSITFDQSLRGGTYAIVGAEMQGTNLLAARFVFPRAPIWQNRKLRPGVLCQNALGDLTQFDRGPYGPLFWGEFGRFSTFEPPQVEWWIQTGTTATFEGRLWLVWLSESMNVVY